MRSFRRSAATEPLPLKTSSDPTGGSSDAEPVISDAPGNGQERQEFAVKKQGRDLTPQEWEDFIRQHGAAMLPPDGEG